MITARDAYPLALAALQASGEAGPLAPLRPDAPPAQAQIFTTATLLLKVYAPEVDTRATRQANRQAEVAQAMAGPHRAPPILLHHGTTLVMPRIPGSDLASLWSQGDRDIPTRAGEWLRAFHALTRRRFPFRPMGQLNWLDRLAGEVTQGTRRPPDPTAFLAAIAATKPMADSARGQKATRAVTHRDMTLSNLLYDGTTTWGIDFENDREDLPLRDLFTLALDLLTSGATPGDLAALRSAYGDQHTAAPVRAFLQRCFCLWVWANTPGQPSLRQAARLTVARDLLTSGTPVL